MLHYDIMDRDDNEKYDRNGSPSVPLQVSISRKEEIRSILSVMLMQEKRTYQCGDYIYSGNSNGISFSQRGSEDLSEIQAKIETEVFVTQKERVDKLPESRGTKLGKNKENKSKLANKSQDHDDILDTKSQANEELPAAKKLV